MQAQRLIALSIAALGLSSAFAQEATPDDWIHTQGTRTRAEVRAELDRARANGELEHIRQYDTIDRNFKSTLSRAEVLADLEIWRRSGLAGLQRGEASPDTFSPQYREAHARYVAMRSSPEFAALVQSIARDRGEIVTAGRPKANTVR